MQLRLQPRMGRSAAKSKFIFKTILFAIVFILVIFLLDQIEVSAPNELIKQEISNDKLITVK